MKWFTEKEFKCRCCGELPAEVQGNVKALVANVLDPAREKLGLPITVNSGYRCKKHNAEVGGVAQSQHLLGEAADIAPASFGFQDSGFKEELKRLGRIIVEGANFDQLIIYPTFLHVSYKRHGNNRKQIIIKK